MRLTIENRTNQTHEFLFRLPEHPGVFAHTVVSGALVKIDRNFTAAEIAAVISHHSRYGLQQVGESVDYDGLVYSIDD